LVDIYRGRSKPCDSLLDYGLFLTFFPHLVAGPIVRAYDFLPQCLEPRRASATQMGWGFSLLVLGLFEKTILADAILAPVADKVFGAAQAAAFVDAWVGTLAFAGQIFFDFAGYSPAPSARLSVWGLCSTTISASPMRRSGFQTSGSAGTFRCRAGCATT